MAWRLGGPGLEHPLSLHVQPCVETNVLDWTGLLWLSFVRTRPLLSHWLCGVSDRLVLRCHRLHGIKGAWFPVPFLIQVVWTHAGVPVMWPAAKLFKSDWSQEQTAHSLSLSVPHQSDSSLRQSVSSFTGRSTCQQLAKSSGTGATFLISSSLWQTIPSPSLPLKTPVRNISYAFQTEEACTYYIHCTVL